MNFEVSFLIRGAFLESRVFSVLVFKFQSTKSFINEFFIYGVSDDSIRGSLDVWFINDG